MHLETERLYNIPLAEPSKFKTSLGRNLQLARTKPSKLQLALAKPSKLTTSLGRVLKTYRMTVATAFTETTTETMQAVGSYFITTRSTGVGEQGSPRRRLMATLTVFLSMRRPREDCKTSSLAPDSRTEQARRQAWESGSGADSRRELKLPKI